MYGIGGAASLDAFYTAMTYNALCMYTIIETPLFSADAASIWQEDERGEFCAWLARCG
ncbi:hypothetical protein PT7_3555 [Pusillimonas sp. T7-7]|nr:hypothetical protein PT7_3555 [Pusillimonas sp. T7-7]